MSDQNEEDIVLEDEIQEEDGVKNKLKKLRNRLKECEAEKRDNLAGWQRAKADLINAKKEFAADKVKLVGFGKMTLIEDLIPTLDSFYSAMKNQESWQKVDANWRTGVEYIHNQLIGTLEDNGLSIILPAEGDSFDDEIHELSDEANISEGNDQIMAVMRPGYQYNDKILRPALVRLKAD